MVGDKVKILISHILNIITSIQLQKCVRHISQRLFLSSVVNIALYKFISGLIYYHLGLVKEVNFGQAKIIVLSKNNSKYQYENL